MKTGSPQEWSRGYRWLRLAAVTLAIDVAASLVLWIGAHLIVRPPEVLPPAAPIAVFYTSQSDELESRLGTAAAAWFAHGRRPLLCVGGARPSRGFFGSEVMARRLMELGIDGGAIRTERKSFDTISNVEAAQRLEPHAPAVVIVSDVLHLWRIRWIMRDSWRTTVPVPTPLNANPLLAWERVHYEVVSWLLLIGPDGLRDRLLRTIRA